MSCLLCGVAQVFPTNVRGVGVGVSRVRGVGLQKEPRVLHALPIEAEVLRLLARVRRTAVAAAERAQRAPRAAPLRGAAPVQLVHARGDVLAELQHLLVERHVRERQIARVALAAERDALDLDEVRLAQRDELRELLDVSKAVKAPRVVTGAVMAAIAGAPSARAGGATWTSSTPPFPAAAASRIPAARAAARAPGRAAGRRRSSIPSARLPSEVVRV